METAHQAAPIGKRVSDAKLAYFDGDFERCLELCSEIQLRTVATASEVALLRARAYLRTGRPHEAQNTIVETIKTHATLDAWLTAQMLLASAHIRQAAVDEGLEILAEAAARACDAHFAVRSEIALCTALGYWAKRELDTAERYLRQVDARSDIIHARALELQAWCQMARQEYRRSAQLFRETLVRLDTCQAGDRVIAATAISTLAIYAAELFDPDLASFVAARSRLIDWSSGLTAQRFTILLHQALFHEFTGNTVEAYHHAMEAREVAPSIAYEAFGWSASSTIAANANEPNSALAFAKRASILIDAVGDGDFVGDERFAILSVAESFAQFDSAKAAQLFARYRALAPIGTMLPLSGDSRLTAEEALVEGMISDARGDRELAQACYRKAFQIFSHVGYVRRAAMAAHASIRIAFDDELYSYLTTHLRGVENYLTRARPAREKRVRALLERHPLVASLTPTKREVILMICLGKSNREIAQCRGVAEQTIKNMLTSDLYRTFGVSSRAELVSKCCFDWDPHSADEVQLVDAGGRS